MPTAETATCESYVAAMREKGLLQGGHLNSVSAFLQAHPEADPDALAGYLVEQQILSRFQAERILDGKIQDLVVKFYTLTDCIGSGSLGPVYKALRKPEGSWFAVKVMPLRSMISIPTAWRYLRPFAQVDHPAVVRIVDMGSKGDNCYFVWPFCDGETLDKMVERKGKLRSEAVTHVALEIAAALDSCHRQGMFHGLLKPSNVLIRPDGQVRVLDFGLGVLLTTREGENLIDTMSHANTMVSNIDCASPESLSDPTQQGPSSDQYSLGCVLYYCLTGRHPFPEGSLMQKAVAHQTQQPTPVGVLNPDVTPELEAVIERLLQKAPADRFASVAEVGQSLRRIPGAEPPSVSVPPLTPRPDVAPVPPPEPAHVPPAPPGQVPIDLSPTLPTGESADRSPARALRPRLALVIGLLAGILVGAAVAWKFIL
jgi:serine/threonine-protein kinase